MHRIMREMPLDGQRTTRAVVSTGRVDHLATAPRRETAPIAAVARRLRTMATRARARAARALRWNGVGANGEASRVLRGAAPDEAQVRGSPATAARGGE